MSLIAHDLIAWTQLCLTGELAIREPKALRYRLLHTAGRLASHPPRAPAPPDELAVGRAELAAAFARLRELPSSAG